MQMLLFNLQRICLGGLGWSSRTVKGLTTTLNIKIDRHSLFSKRVYFLPRARYKNKRSGANVKTEIKTAVIAFLYG